MEVVENSKAVVYAIIDRLLKNQGKPTGKYDEDTELYIGGLGFDSLTVAELSALLEKRLGKDPFSANQFPVTIGELLEFYD